MRLDRLYDPFATRRRRLLSFFLLYMSEGIPQGLTSVAIATQLRRQDLSPSEIGGFIAALTIPWSWKWVMGPVLDTFYSNRIGRRRLWIVSCQILMILTLLMSLWIEYKTQFTWLIAIVIIHNIFAATQDIAIDALACSVLLEHERGLANGLMFSGAYLGNAVGGAGVLLLSPYIGFSSTFLLVGLGILTITLTISVQIREAPIPGATAITSIRKYIKSYLGDVFRGFFGTRRAVAGVVFALLPAGAYALSLGLQSNLCVDLGLTDSQIGLMNLLSTVISAFGCVVGGILSDRLGRRMMIAIYIICTLVPTIYLALVMQRSGWSNSSILRDHPSPSSFLITTFWIVSLVYALIQGLIYGTRTALFMDICNPLVAATQFTAFMSLLNIVNAYSAWWQGKAIDQWGYPTTLWIDAIFGCLSVLLLPWVNKASSDR